MKTPKKPCCASCGSCKTCGASLEDGGYEWRKKRYCSEACVRAGGYRDNPASKAMARIERLIHHGWKPTMAEYMVLREVEPLGFKLRVTCMDSVRETGQFRSLSPDLITYIIRVEAPAPPTPAQRRTGAASEKRREHASFKTAMNQLGWSRDTGAWWKHVFVDPSILDAPEEQLITGIQSSHSNHRNNPPKSTPPRYAVYSGKKVLRRFHDERNALIFADQNSALVWDNARNMVVRPNPSTTALAVGGVLLAGAAVAAVTFVRGIGRGIAGYM